MTKYSNIGIARDRNPVAFFTGLGKTSTKKMLLKYEFFPKGGGVPAEPKVLRHFLFALKQSKANKCQCAKRLKTVKKFFLKFLLNNFGKKWKKCLENSKSEGGGSEAFGKNSYLSHIFFMESFPNNSKNFELRKCPKTLNSVQSTRRVSRRNYAWRKDVTFVHFDL